MGFGSFLKSAGGGKLIGGLLNIGGSLIGAKAEGEAAKRSAEAERYAAELEQQQRQRELIEGGRQFNKSYGLRSDIERTALSDREARQLALQKAYYDTIAKGGQLAAEGEGGLMASLNTPSTTLANVEKDILSGQSEAMQNATGQIGANLAQQGVRGGQAATQLRRGVGHISKDALSEITQLKHQDEMRREAAKRAYLASKAQMGTQAQYQPAYF